MLKVIGFLVPLLIVSVFSNELNEIIVKEQRNHCPDDTSEIPSIESILGLSCINLNCENETQLCWGSIFCIRSSGTSCELFDGLLCQNDGITSSSFQVCRSLSTVKDSEVKENSSEEKVPSRSKLLGSEGRDLSSKSTEDTMHTLGKCC